MNIRNGFTLIELAIALMVIGLLIGGVLKGQELIENAKATRTIKDITDYNTAVLIFRNSYGGLPGDLRNAATRLPNCTNYPCNNTVGVGMGYLDTPNYVKRANFWRHLERVKLITNINETGDHHTTSPLNAFGGHNSIDYNNTDFGDALVPNDSITYYNIMYMFDPMIGSLVISPVRMRTMDYKIDDGKPLTGSVRLKASYSGTSPPIDLTLCLNTSTNEYLSNPAAACSGWYMMSGMN